MIAPVIAAVLAIAKASTAFDSILRQLLASYAAHRRAQNTAFQGTKDARNAALVAGVDRDDVWIGLCRGCPIITGQSTGQHVDPVAASAVQPGGSGGA